MYIAICYLLLFAGTKVSYRYWMGHIALHLWDKTERSWTTEHLMLWTSLYLPN